MRLLLKEIRYRLPLILISVAIFEVCWFINSNYEMLEYNYYLLPIVACGLLLGSKDEIELIRASKTRISNIMLIRYVITYLFLTLYPVLRLLTITEASNSWRLVLSFVISLLFATSISLLFRVIFNNPFGIIIYSALIHLLIASTFQYLLSKIVSDYQMVRRITPYGAHAIKDIGLFVNNRLLVSGMALIIITISYLIMRYRKSNIFM